MDHVQIGTNRIRLHVVQAGPASGPLVILLHGFPEYWYGWRRQIDALAGRGFRVWAPDQRGYNLSDKPAGVAAYRVDTLVDDVIGLIDAAAVQKVGLVGHDWGGVVAWATAAMHPERISRLVVLNAPHAAVMRRHVPGDLRQLARSWYVGMFQVPWVPERVAQLGNWWLLANTLRRSSRPGTFTDEDFVQYRDAWNQPGAFTAMVNWYRAAVRLRSSRQASGRITVPALLIWGAKDRFLRRVLAVESLDWCDAGRLVFSEGATHWMQHEEPAFVNDLISEFLQPL